jgi:hypothetical protein
MPVTSPLWECHFTDEDRVDHCASRGSLRVMVPNRLSARIDGCSYLLAVRASTPPSPKCGVVIHAPDFSKIFKVY